MFKSRVGLTGLSMNDYQCEANTIAAASLKGQNNQAAGISTVC